MAGFLYYIPGQPTLRREQIGPLGLDYALGGKCKARHCLNGPGGGGEGCIAVHPDQVPAELHGFWPERQTWRQIPGAAGQAGVWVGTTNGVAITPQDLARPDGLPGAAIELADGQRWECPIARQYQRQGEEIAWCRMLPERLDLAADGTWTKASVVNRYAALWEAAELWARCRHGLGTPGDVERLAGGQAGGGENDLAVLCLQTNYTLGRIEAAILGLLSPEIVVRILDVLIDEPTLLTFIAEDQQKKTTDSKTPAGCSSLAGPAGELPSTDQPLPT